ncbi:succinate dehydrogenase / fumarate reductase iron-sulfur subunit [Kibdelosporangium aridum]|uniref:Succinate dehydrogenase / fumarate reductase iron-sulfur subunit n=1 Tax=Kibdelosporangium aridum TaxID=2030 RepID=A0A1W2CT73_KIBAR|nr:succinate dehydrogenase / fumarate reductase iron-sulfur subunit [Kibdelosporangium aridum]
MKVLVKGLLVRKRKPTTISIAPIKGLEVRKDPLVDMEPFFEAFPVRDHIRQRADTGTNPATGPTTSASTIRPSASCAPDNGAGDRLDILNDTEGVWRCRTTFNYTDACPAASKSPKQSKKSNEPYSSAAES